MEVRGYECICYHSVQFDGYFVYINRDLGGDGMGWDSKE